VQVADAGAGQKWRFNSKGASEGIASFDLIHPASEPARELTFSCYASGARLVFILLAIAAVRSDDQAAALVADRGCFNAL